MMQDDGATNPAEGGPSAIERVQRELAETRTTLQDETTHLSQLQDTLAQALEVARSVRLEAIRELDRLAGDLMDAARRDAAAIRTRAEDDARAMIARAEEEIRDLRARTDEEIAGQRAALERRVRAAQAELDRIQAAWNTAAQALTEARRNLTEDMGDALSGVLGGIAASSAAGAVADTGATAGAAARGGTASAAAVSAPGWGPAPTPEAPVEPAAEAAPAAEESAADVLEPAVQPSAEEAEEPRDVSHFGLPLDEEPAEREVAAAAGRPETTEELGPDAGEPVGIVRPGGDMADREALSEAPPGSMLDQASQQLRAGDVAGALDTFRGVVDRSPDEVEGVISQLTAMLQDPTYRQHHEEVRLLLVDAYMVQGDYDRAMSLLHEPAG